MLHYNDLLLTAKNELKAPLFGFYLGQEIKASDYGLLGYVVESANNLQTAIQALLKYDALVADIGEAIFDAGGDNASICWQPDTDCNEHVVLRNMTAWVAMSRQLFDNNLTPTLVSFRQSLSAQNQQVLTNWFGCNVEIDANENKVVFPTSYLTLAIKSENKRVYQLLIRESEQELAQLQTQQDLSLKVSQFLQQLADLQQVELPLVAATFYMTPRTFQRRLLKEQQYFSTLLDNERKRRTLQLLSTLSCGDIATTVGFKEQSAFNRAFKRWFCCSPKAYLKQLAN